MSLACSSIHKKPVCDKCDARTSCTKCCTCQPRTRGRPKSTQIHICHVLKTMGCDEYEKSVRTLPSIEIRRQVECASDKEIDQASIDQNTEYLLERHQGMGACAST